MRKKQLFFVMIMTLCASAAMADLVGYWNFNEGSGMAVADSSGNGMNGTLYSANGSNYPQWVAGYNGGALRFNAASTGSANSNHVTVAIDPNVVDPNQPGLTSLGEVFTFSMWVRRDAVDYFNNLFPRLVHTSAYDIQLALDPSGGAASPDSYDYFGWTGVGGDRFAIGLETDAQKTLGSWYHLAVTCDGENVKKYINGVEVTSVSVPGVAMPNASTSFFIGSKLDNTSYFTGALDDVAVWSGGYLPPAEIEKLANNTATPLSVEEIIPDPPLPPNYFRMENNFAWNSGGWKQLYGPSFSKFTYWSGDDIVLSANNTAGVWYIKDIETPGWPNATMKPGGHYALWGTGQRFWYYFANLDAPTANYYESASRDVEAFGMAWIDPAWSGRDPNVAVFAPYITPGIAMGIPETGGYQDYNAGDWRYKNYFKTYARVAAVNANGARLCVQTYKYTSSDIAYHNPMVDPNVIVTPVGEPVYLPLTKGDYEWQELKFGYPKPSPGAPRVWTEISIVGGDVGTRVYIDEFNPVSNLPTKQESTGYDSPPFTTYYLLGDYNKNTVVDEDDLLTLGGGWLDYSTGMLEPRNGGLLSNADFYQDFDRIGSEYDAHQAIDPIGWTISRSGTSDYGIWRVAQRGQLNYGTGTYGPLGGSIAAYTTDMVVDDPYGVLEQTASQTAVTGQTYYAMGYVMGSHPDDSWRSWKDTCTMTIAVNGVDVATFTRKLSRNIWRPIYGSYTATAADAGKPIAIRFSYANTHTVETALPGNMYVGYAFLGTTIPVEWPEARPNKLTNGGFEDLSALESVAPAVAQSIRNGDNWGAWFVAGVPAPTGWVYEVPAGYSLADKGGIWASGFYGTPLPSPGLSDVAIYTSNTLVLGQVVGSLTAGTTYYLDMSCGVNASYYNSSNWPNPAPVFHIELWRIPAGVTDGTVIYNAIASSNPGYVKVAGASVSATGNITNTPWSKWQLIGTSYTATASDTNMYVRVRGTGGIATNPEYAFNDVNLSTAKRLVPGGTYSFNVSPAMQYTVLGPYNCFHGTQMGTSAPVEDLNGDCIVNMKDLAVMAGNWLENWYSNISGVVPWM